MDAGRKRAILASRLDATSAIVGAIGAAARAGPPEGPRQRIRDRHLRRPARRRAEREARDRATSFLAGVVVAWERAARAAEAHGVRVVLARTALIVAPEALGVAADRCRSGSSSAVRWAPAASGSPGSTSTTRSGCTGSRCRSRRSAARSTWSRRSRAASASSPGRSAEPSTGRAGCRIPACAIRLLLRDQATLLHRVPSGPPGRPIAAGYRFRFPTSTRRWPTSSADRDPDGTGSPSAVPIIGPCPSCGAGSIPPPRGPRQPRRDGGPGRRPARPPGDASRGAAPAATSARSRATRARQAAGPRADRPTARPGRGIPRAEPARRDGPVRRRGARRRDRHRHRPDRGNHLRRSSPTTRRSRAAPTTR